MTMEGPLKVPGASGRGVGNDSLFAWSFQGKVSYFLGEWVVSHEAQEAALLPEKFRALSPANWESSPNSVTSSLKVDGVPLPRGTLGGTSSVAPVPSAGSGVGQVIHYLKATLVNFLKDAINQNHALRLLLRLFLANA